MGLRLDQLGVATEPRTAVVDPERALAYAAATNDDNPAYRSGLFAPPVFGVVPTWAPLTELTTQVIPGEALPMVVHGEQDMHFHRPLVPGQELSTVAEAYSVRVGASGTRFTTRLLSIGTDGGLVLESFVTTFVRGMTDGESAGPDKPEHSFPEGARARPVGEFTVHVDEDQTYRYRDASGDNMPIHVDDWFARMVGLPGIIVHGLCTMAMCSQAVIKTVAGGDPTRLRRLAVRFSRNLFPGSDLTVSLYDAGRAGPERAVYAFEAYSRGDQVISHGRAEVEDGA